MQIFRKALILVIIFISISLFGENKQEAKKPASLFHYSDVIVSNIMNIDFTQIHSFPIFYYSFSSFHSDYSTAFAIFPKTVDLNNVNRNMNLTGVDFLFSFKW